MLNFLGILAYPRGLALASGPCLHHPGSLSPALFWGPVLGQGGHQLQAGVHNWVGATLRSWEWAPASSLAWR